MEYSGVWQGRSGQGVCSLNPACILVPSPLRLDQGMCSLNPACVLAS